MPHSFRTSRRVEFRDTDAAGIVHFSVFFTYMEEAEHALWRELGLSVKHKFDDGVITWPRVAAHCDYVTPIRFEDVVDIDVSVERIGVKSVVFAFKLSQAGRHVAAGQLTAVCCRLTPSGPPESIVIPEEIRAKLSALVEEIE
jgi:4-hydroxybenzoyl-CoA thioesterase/acyl-CoA thioester hydrolase